jgi:asparagine synthase (glutamine-hydrolysing)
MVPTYYVSHLARQYVTVALSGEGGDELFAGYDWHRKFVQIQKYQSLVPKQIRAGFSGILPDSRDPRISKSAYSSLLFRASIANRLSLFDRATSYKNLISVCSESTEMLIFNPEFIEFLLINGKRELLAGVVQNSEEVSSLSFALRADFSTYLPGDLLTKVDRMSMMNSLEVRSPLLDYRLAELSMMMPDSLKLKRSESKYILREAVKSVLPTEVAQRRTKRGFSVPVSDWLRNEHYDYAKSIIFESESLNWNIFNKNGIELLFNRHKSGHYNYGPQLWYLLVFALWSKEN